MHEQGLTEPTPVSHRERITIALLMVWTATSALWLAMNRRRIPATGDAMDAFFQSLGYWSAANQALLVGAGLAVVILAVWRFLKGGPRIPSQPGHWLLMIAGIVPLVNYLVWIAPPWSRNIPARRLIAFYVSEALLLIALKYLAARAQRDHWRWVFRLGILLSAIGLLTGMGGFLITQSFTLLTINGLLPWIAVLAMGVSAWLDLKRRIPRDSLHWAGLAVIIMQQVLDFTVPSLLYFWHAPSAP